jgi:hypothetical protein
MAVRRLWDSSAGIRARQSCTLWGGTVFRRRNGDQTVGGKKISCDARRRWTRIWCFLRTSVGAATVLSFLACAGPEPMLRSNAKVQLQGVEISKLDVAACQQKAESAGLQPGTTNRGGNIAAGGTLGLVAGAAVGASAGLIGGVTGIAIGAAAGGGLGLIIGLAGGAYKPLEPDPPYADAVVRCLIEKGYEVSGWE